MRVALLIMMQFAAPAVQALLPTVPAFTRVSSPTQSLHRLPKSVAAVSVGGEDVSNQKLARNLAGAYLGAFLFGYHLGVVNAPLREIATTLGFSGNAAVQGLVVSTTVGGAFAGSLAGGSLASARGRRGTLAITSGVLAAGTAVCAIAPSTNALLVGRAICGLGIGLSGAVAPLFISELSPPSRRGAMGAYNQIFVCVGILASILVGLPVGTCAAAGGGSSVETAAVATLGTALGLSKCAAAAASTAGSSIACSVNSIGSNLMSSLLAVPWWRCMFAFATVPALVQWLALRKWAPESPAWLQAQTEKRTTDAAATSVATSSSTTSKDDNGWSILLDPKHRRAAATGSLLFALQQFAGVNAVVFFSTAVFEKVGVPSAVAASALVMATNIAGTVGASRIIDKVGRKPLLAGSFAGMAAAMAIMAAVPASAALAGPINVLGTVAYIGAFAMGAGPIPALLLGELVEDPRARGKAASMAMATHWACNLAVSVLFLHLVQHYSVSFVYRAFAAVAALATAFVITAVPETARKKN